MHFAEEWFIEGDRFADSFNPRQPVISSHGRLGYFKVLQDGRPSDPWDEQWANEQLFSGLAHELGLPCVDAAAATIGEQRGAVVVFREGRKLIEIEQLGFATRHLVENARNREQLPLMVALDLWAMNVDRGGHNVFVVTDEGHPVIDLIDHGHTFLLPRESKGLPEQAQTEHFEALLEDDAQIWRPEWVRRVLADNVLRQFVDDADLRAAAARITQLDDALVEQLVDGVEDGFLRCPDEVLCRLLSMRRERLPELLEAAL